MRSNGLVAILRFENFAGGAEIRGSDLCLQPVLELRQRESTMRYGVLLRFVHLGIGLALILEDGIPA